MFGSTPLDVALGLALTYQLFALLCSSIREGIGRFLEEREAGLVAGLFRILGEHPPSTLTGLYLRGKAAAIVATRPKAPAAAAASGADATKTPPDPTEIVSRLLSHGLLRGMAKEGKAPSHLPPQSFSLALLDALARGAPSRTVADARTLVARLPESGVKEVLEPLVASAGDDMARLQNAIEKRFNDTIESASAWYKQRTQLWVALIAIVVAVGANVDSIDIGSSASPVQAHAPSGGRAAFIDKRIEARRRRR